MVRPRARLWWVLLLVALATVAMWGARTPWVRCSGWALLGARERAWKDAIPGLPGAATQRALAPVLVDLASDPAVEAETRQRAVRTLGCLPQARERVLPRLLELLGDDGLPQELRADTALALAAHAPVPPEAVPLLIRLRHDAARDMHGGRFSSYSGSSFPLLGLRLTRREGSAPRVLRRLNGVEQAFAAYDIALEYAGEAAVEAQAPITFFPPGSTWVEAVHAAGFLRHLGPRARAALPVLRESLRCGHEVELTCHALWTFGAEGAVAVPDLLAGLDPGDFRFVRGRTALQLDPTCAPVVVEELRRRLTMKEGEPGDWASILTQVGEPAVVAIPELLDCLEPTRMEGVVEALAELGRWRPEFVAAALEARLWQLRASEPYWGKERDVALLAAAIQRLAPSAEHEAEFVEAMLDWLQTEHGHKAWRPQRYSRRNHEWIEARSTGFFCTNTLRGMSRAQRPALENSVRDRAATAPQCFVAGLILEPTPELVRGLAAHAADEGDPARAWAAARALLELGRRDELTDDLLIRWLGHERRDFAALKYPWSDLLREYSYLPSAVSAWMARGLRDGSTHNLIRRLGKLAAGDRHIVEALLAGVPSEATPRDGHFELSTLDDIAAEDPYVTQGLLARMHETGGEAQVMLARSLATRGAPPESWAPVLFDRVRRELDEWSLGVLEVHMPR